MTLPKIESKIIISYDWKDQLKDTLIRYELGLCLFTINPILEVLDQIKLLRLYDHLPFVEIELNLFGLGVG